MPGRILSIPFIVDGAIQAHSREIQVVDTPTSVSIMVAVSLLSLDTTLDVIGGHPIFPLHGRIPMVFDGIVRSSMQELRDLRPPIADAIVFSENDRVLLRAPRVLADVWIQVIVPSLSALLPNASW